MTAVNSAEQSTTAPSPLLTTGQAGEFLQLTTRALEERRRRGTGPPYVRLGATTVRYQVSDLEQWIAERTYSSTADEAARLREAP